MTIDLEWGGQCEPCASVRWRHPELFEWVMRVTRFQRSLLAPNAPDPFARKDDK